MESAKVDTHKILLWSLMALVAGLIAGFVLFSPTLTFIVPDGYHLHALEPSEPAAVKMRFVLLWALLFVLIPVLNRNLKRTKPKHLPLVLMIGTALIGAFVCALYLRSQLAFFGYHTQTGGMPAYVFSLKSTRIERVPTAGIAAAFITFAVLKHFSQHKHNLNIQPRHRTRSQVGNQPISLTVGKTLNPMRQRVGLLVGQCVPFLRLVFDPHHHFLE